MIWDRDNLNAPHTEREIGNNVPRAMTYREYLEWREKARELAQDGEPATGSTTEPENATCRSAGGFGASAGKRLIAAAKEALEIVKAGNLREMTLDEAWAQRLSNLKPMATDEAIAHALRNDAGWMAWQEVQRLRAKNAAILDAIAAERASWPHAGSMHDGARHACDAIAARIRAIMGVTCQ